MRDGQDDMKSYIVRVYRQEENNPRNFVGTIEDVEAAEKKAFGTLEELGAILNPVQDVKKQGRVKTGAIERSR